MNAVRYFLSIFVSIHVLHKVVNTKEPRKHRGGGGGGLRVGGGGLRVGGERDGRGWRGGRKYQKLCEAKI
jgi:hypothetical protein